MLLIHFVSGSGSHCFLNSINSFEFWIAGQKLQDAEPQSCEKPFYWKLPKDIHQSLGYTNWATGSLLCYKEPKDCMDVSYRSGFRWSPASCDEKKCPLCEIL